MGSPNLTWIQTRDGSPTLWSNEISESYRSVKGAFTESWAAFVGPGLAYLQRESHLNQPVSRLTEYGLGAGTNWALWTLGLKALRLPFPEYVAIERDLRPFEMGRPKFSESAATLSEFLAKRGLILSAAEVRETLLTAPAPRVFASLAAALESAGAERGTDIWFHDPFGYDINPDGYSAETIRQASGLLAPRFWGASYACNRYFQRTLKVIPGVILEKHENGPIGLKRERLEFFRQ